MSDKLKNGPEKLTDEQFSHAVKTLIDNAMDNDTNNLQPVRERLTDYYAGNIDVKPRPGFSGFVMHELSNAVETAMPMIMAAICGTTTPVEFSSATLQGKAGAKLASAYMNSVVFSENNGWIVVHDNIKSSLMSRITAFKVEIDEKKEFIEKIMEGETSDMIHGYAAETGGEVTGELKPYGDKSADASVQLFTGRMRYKIGDGPRICISAVDPASLIVSKGVRTADEAACIGEHQTVLAGDLVAMGVPQSVIVEHGGASGKTDQEGERAARTDSQQDADKAVTNVWALEPIECAVVYVRIDKDGDGKLERYLVTTVGPDYYVVDELTKPVADGCQPYVIWSSVRTPNELIGMAWGELCIDIQNLTSYLMRQILDNITLANQPRREVVEGQVHLGDLFNEEMDGVVRVRAPGMIRYIETPFVAGNTIPVLEFVEREKEMRTGISRQSAGLDSQSMQSSTELGIAAVIDGIQRKIQMLVRLAAETGLKPMWLKALRLAKANGLPPREFEVDGTPSAVDPKNFDLNMGVTVNVGIGKGSVDTLRQILMSVIAKQEAIFKEAGIDNPFVTPSNYINTLAQFIGTAPTLDVTSMFVAPQLADQKGQDIVKAQREAASKPDPKAEAMQQKMQMDAQLAQANSQLQAQQAQQKAQLDQQKQLFDQQMQVAQHQATIQAQQMKMQDDHALAQMKAQHESEIAQQKLLMENTLKRIELISESQLKKYEIDENAKVQGEKNKAAAGTRTNIKQVTS